QNGIDVYGLPKNETAYYGIQCKGKDDYTQAKLTEEEINNEIGKALNFRPKLKRVIFATTANKDVAIEEFIRKKNLEHIQKGRFEVYVSSWEDIVDLLEERRDTYNWYINNCQYKDLSDVEVFIDWGKEYIIHPEYLRTTITYALKDNNPYNTIYQDIYNLYNSSKIVTPSFNPLYTPRKINYTWCEIPINIKNAGSTVIEDYKLYLTFEPDKIEELDDMFYYPNSPLMSQAAVAQIYASRQAEREVFKSSEWYNVIEYRPLDNILVQDDSKRFIIRVKPKQNEDKICVRWSVKSRNYQNNGQLYLNVIPKYEDRTKIVYVIDNNDLKEKEIIIEPKIVEE
ncbi:MAG: hypothetical protein PHS38_09265, partial [Bacteroidales bacterium]|nr:hypothetical protein [Bacteroidales bacterium]